MTRIKCTFLLILAAVNILPAQNRRSNIDTSEGTWMSLDVSPYGARIVVDLLGDIYSIPATGGEAACLTPLPKLTPGKGTGAAFDDTPHSGQAFETQPRFSLTVNRSPLFPTATATTTFT